MDKSSGAPQELAKTILELGKFLELADHRPGRVKLTVSLLNLPRVYTVLGGATDAGDHFREYPGTWDTRLRWGFEAARW